MNTYHRGSSPSPPSSQYAFSSAALSNPERAVSSLPKSYSNLRGRKPYVYNQKCGVCSEPAVDHYHYGAISCFPCRQFFKRAIDKKSYKDYTCAGDWSLRY